MFFKLIFDWKKSIRHVDFLGLKIKSFDCNQKAMLRDHRSSFCDYGIREFGRICLRWRHVQIQHQAFKIWWVILESQLSIYFHLWRSFWRFTHFESQKLTQGPLQRTRWSSMLCFNSQPFFSRFATDWSSDEVTLSGLCSIAVKRCKVWSSTMIIVRLSSNSGFSSKKVAKHPSQSIAKVSKFKFNDLTECAGITVPWCESFRSATKEPYCSLPFEPRFHCGFTNL